MIIKTQKSIAASEITDPLIFKQRRQIIKSLLAITGAGFAPAWASENKPLWDNLPQSDFTAHDLTPTPLELIKNYTNYYELSLIHI